MSSILENGDDQRVLRARGRLSSFALVICLLAGCSQTSWTSKDQLREVLSPEAVILPVPVVLQESETDCGLSSLVALLKYHGKEVDEEARRQFSAEATAEEGIRAGEIRDYLKGRGFRAVLVHGALDHEYPTGILALLDRRLPLLVELEIEGAVGSSRHYALVVGYDPGERWILLLDPSRGIGGMPYGQFEKQWAKADHLTLVTAPVSKAGGA